MRQIVNEKHIERQSKIGKNAPLAGMGLLIIATVLMFQRPDLIALSMLLVWVGFVASILSNYLGERYLGPAAHHNKVPESLKGLGNRYTLLVYQTPVPFVLIGPGGLTVIIVSSQGGRVTYDEEKGRWHHEQKMGMLRRFMGQEGLGQPHRIAASEVSALQAWLAKRLPEGMEIPTRAVLLFVHPDVYLEADDAPITALRGSEIKRWVRDSANRRDRLADAQRSALYAALEIEEDAG